MTWRQFIQNRLVLCSVQLILIILRYVIISNAISFFSPAALLSESMNCYCRKQLATPESALVYF